jgi:hypothetical protein
MGPLKGFFLGARTRRSDKKCWIHAEEVKIGPSRLLTKRFDLMASDQRERTPPKPPPVILEPITPDTLFAVLTRVSSSGLVTS